jgi:hypothetical protein
MAEPVRVFPVTDRAQRKSKSPTPSKSIAKLFPNDRVFSKTPVPDRADFGHTPIPKLKLRTIAPALMPEVMPYSMRDYERKENIKGGLGSVSAREVLAVRDENCLGQAKMTKLQALGDVLQKLIASSKLAEDSLLEILKIDSPSHSSSGCALCGCTCKSSLSAAVQGKKQLCSKQTLLLDICDQSSVKDCSSCGNKFYADVDSVMTTCSLCQQNCILAKQDKLTLQLKFKLEQSIVTPPRRREVSPRLFRLRSDRVNEFPPRFSTPTKNVFPTQHSLCTAKEVQTDPVSTTLQLAVTGQKLSIKLTETEQSLHFILPDPSRCCIVAPLPLVSSANDPSVCFKFSDFTSQDLSLPLSEYVNSMSTNLLETQKDLKTLSTKDEQTRLITPKFNGPFMPEESTIYPDNSHSVVHRPKGSYRPRDMV